MCKDVTYILAGLCCVSDTCGVASLTFAISYIKDYCETWKEEAPLALDDLNCATFLASHSTASATATSTRTETETAVETTRSRDGAGSEDAGGGPNIGLIAGVAGGVVAFILVISVVFFFCWRKRKNEKLTAAHSDTTDLSRLTEETHFAGPHSKSDSPLQPMPFRSQAGYQGYFSNMPTPPAYAAHMARTSPMHPELGTDGAMPHGSELYGREIPPARPELQGMSFATRSPFPVELPSNCSQHS